MPGDEPVIVIGAGPAGLTAAYQLVKHRRKVIVLEADPDQVGGICRTARHEGFRFDIGGHRFFSKSAEIEALWEEMLPEPGDFLTRKRSSRIFYRNRFFSYPLKPMEALFGLGLWESFRCGLSYLRARMFPHPSPANFEEWVSNQFGKHLYSIFFKTYTEKVWGMPCTEISADWAAQRIKGLSLSTAVLSALFPRRARKGEVVKTLIDSFRYPRKGPGMLWESCAEKVRSLGGEIRMGQRVTALSLDGESGRWTVTSTDAAGTEQNLAASHVISSAPIRNLARMFHPPLGEAARTSAESLAYRDFLTVAVMVREKEGFDDQWIYIHDPDVQVGRVQNFHSWSPEMVPEEGMTCYGMEYFCFAREEGLWAMEDSELADLAVRELELLGLATESQVVDSCVVRQEKAYPVYDEDYAGHVDVIRRELEERYPGIHLVGRNGMHKYNNQDHSMMTAILCVENILAGETVYDLWRVNEDAAYTESGESDHSVSGLRQVPGKVKDSG